MKDKMITINIGNMKIKIENNGFRVRTSDMVTPAHSHANFEFHMLLKGGSVMYVEEQKLNLVQDDYMLIFPDTFHCISSLTDDAQILCFGFSAEKINNSTAPDFYSNFISYTSKQSEYVLTRNNPVVSGYLKKINAHQNLNSVFFEEATRALLVLIFTEILLPFFEKNMPRETESNENFGYYSQTIMIENYFNDHYMENITLSKLASLLYLSEKQTNRIFKKTFGVDFREYLGKIRMKSAKKLLRETDDDVKDIAEAVGYRSYNGFYLAFRSRFGMSPLEYRRKIRS